MTLRLKTGKLDSSSRKSTADGMLGRKSGPELAGPAAPATTALSMDHIEAFFNKLSYTVS